MNLLSIAQEAAAIVGTERPETLFNKNNTQSLLFLSLLRDTLESIRRYGDWAQTIREGSFYILSGKYRYEITDICEDFFSLVPDTVYIKDSEEKVIGSLSPEAFIKASLSSGKRGGNALNESFYLKGGAFCFASLPPVGSKVVFQYQTKNILREAEKKEGSIYYKADMTKDTDIPLFDAYLVKLGLIWRWYKRNGMPYEEEYQEYLTELKKSYADGRMIENISLLGGGFLKDFSLGDVHVTAKTNG